MKTRRHCEDSNVGVGVMIMFISTGIMACIILATMINLTERTAQTPEAIMNLATREISDKIIIHEIYIWDEWDNYGIIWELAPGSSLKQDTQLYWILQCTDPNDVFWSFWGDFTTGAGGGMDIPPHEFTSKHKTNAGLKAEFFDNQGMGHTLLPENTNRIPDIITVESQINYPDSGAAWNTDSVGNLPWADEFSLRASGYVDIVNDGTYTFELTSDDGSKLWVDGELVVDNDGHHGMDAVEGSIDLIAGKVPIHLEYYENLGGAGLELRWEGPGIGKQIIPGASLSHDDNQANVDGGDYKWVTTTSFEPGTVYEISIDQKNGMKGRNNAGLPVGGDTCGPTQLHNNNLKGQLTLIVANGGSTWTEFSVPNDLAGTTIV